MGTLERVEVRMRGAPREPHTRVQEGSANQETQRKDSTKSYTQRTQNPAADESVCLLLTLGRSISLSEPQCSHL